jgi:hypothetical protein
MLTPLESTAIVTGPLYLLKDLYGLKSSLRILLLTHE